MGHDDVADAGAVDAMMCETITWTVSRLLPVVCRLTAQMTAQASMGGADVSTSARDDGAGTDRAKARRSASSLSSLVEVIVLSS